MSDTPPPGPGKRNWREEGRPNLKQLRLLALFADCLDAQKAHYIPIVTAAQTLGCTRQYLSDEIKEIEKIYSAELLDRDHNMVTDWGRELIAWACRTIAEYDRGKMLPVRGKEQIHLGVSGMVAAFLMPGLICR